MTVARGGTVHFEVDIWIENTLMPYVVWRKDLPFSWSDSDPQDSPKIVIDKGILEAAVNGQVRIVLRNQQNV